MTDRSPTFNVAGVTTADGVWGANRGDKNINNDNNGVENNDFREAVV